MAIQKNTNDLLSQAASTLPNNTTQAISPQDVREAVENTAFSSFNKITDAALVGLKAYSTLVTYESGQACISGGAIYIANQVTSPGAFNPAHWTLYVSGSGTLNRLAKFSSTGPVTNSTITDNGTNYLLSLLSSNGFVKTSGGTGLLSVSAQVAATEGGTGKSSWVSGSIPYISATNTFSEVLVGTNGHFLSLVGGVPTWAAVTAPNLGTANLTSADDARTFTLKTGTTATQNFQIKNSAGTVGYYFDGANTLNFGDTTKFVKPTIYLDSTLTDQMHIRRGSSTFFVLNPLNYALNLVGPSGYRTDLYGNGQVYVTGPSAGFFADNTAGQRIYRQDIQSGTDCYVLMASGSTNKTAFYAGYGNYFIDNVAIGDTYTFTEKFRVKGSGSTSATTTALFQNSSSVAALKVKDDLYCIFRAKDAAIPDADLANNELSFYIEEATNDLHFKVKFSTGTVKSGKINLT